MESRDRLAHRTRPYTFGDWPGGRLDPPTILIERINPRRSTAFALAREPFSSAVGACRSRFAISAASPWSMARRRGRFVAACR